MDKKIDELPDCVLTKAQAATMIGVSRDTLDRLHQRNQGPPRVRLSERRVGYITVSGAQIGGGAELINIDAVLDDITARFDAKSVKPMAIKAADTQQGADIAVDVDIEALIRTGAPRGIRSEMFSRVVWSLATSGCTVDEIQQKLAAHPNGIGSKYAGRLEREVERCFRKWQLRNPKRATQDKAPGWPDLTEEGEPKRTYRNARAA